MPNLKRATLGELKTLREAINKELADRARKVIAWRRQQKRMQKLGTAIGKA